MVKVGLGIELVVHVVRVEVLAVLVVQVVLPELARQAVHMVLVVFMELDVRKIKVYRVQANWYTCGWISDRVMHHCVQLLVARRGATWCRSCAMW